MESRWVKAAIICPLGFSDSAWMEKHFLNLAKNKGFIVYHDNKWLFPFCEACKFKDESDICMEVKLEVIGKRRRI